MPLVSNVVHRFTCPRDTSQTCIGMSSKHLLTRARKYLNHKFRKSAIEDHLRQYEFCSISEINLVSSFTVLKKSSIEYNEKVHKALLIKQKKRLLNKLLHANSCSFLSKIFQCIYRIRSLSINLLYLPCFVRLCVMV